ncbi:unnamed protein product [Arabidopsis halleri]
MDDSFTQLTDDLLIKILSFVPIKDAVTTSLLSKRWQSLWTLLPRLNFKDCWVDDHHSNRILRTLSSDFIFATLLLHKAPVLESFILHKYFECSALQVEFWVRFAVDRFVRCLKIDFSYLRHHCLIRLPSRLFRCETLETLKLINVTFLEVPSRVSFHSLKKLMLMSVRYPDEESFIRLISTSPVLEDLWVDCCKDDNVETFTIDVPSLLSLTVWNDSEDHYKRFVIHSHSLNKLDIVEEQGEVNLIGDMPELVVASLRTYESKGNVLESLTFVKRLSLSLDYRVQYPIGATFFQLVCLEFCGFGENWWNLLVHVLQHSPILQILKFKDDGMVENEETEFCWILPSCAPECLLFHLKTFEWTYYEGKLEQKEVAIYILKNARRLVTATVRCGSYWASKQAFEELEFATRGSRACELTMC